MCREGLGLERLCCECGRMAEMGVNGGDGDGKEDLRVIIHKGIVLRYQVLQTRRSRSETGNGACPGVDV